MGASLRFRRVWLAAGLATVVAAAGLVQGQTKPAAKETAKPAAKDLAKSAPDVKADIADAIKSLETGQYEVFLEKYAPVEVLRKVREQDVVERFAEAFGAERETRLKIIAVLKLMAKHEPKYDRSRGLAEFSFDPNEDEVAQIRKPIEPPAPKVTPGFGKDLAKAIAGAEQSLEAKDYQAFVQKMFPPAALGRLDSEGVAALAAELKEDPAMARQMAEDLKALKTLKPEMSDGGKTASFKLEPIKSGAEDPKVKKGETEDEKPQAERVVKFSLIGDDWRFFDDTARVTKALAEFATGKGRTTTVTIKMERIGGNWRLQNFNF